MALSQVLEKLKTTLVYNRHVMSFNKRLFNFVAFSLLFSGSTLFHILQFLACFFFDFLFRVNSCACDKSTTKKQRSLGKGDTKAKINDWENPEVIGRNRRPAHVKLFSFRDEKSGREYWSKVYSKDQDKRNDMIQENMLKLTDFAVEWDFAMVGSPDDVPEDWFTFAHTSWRTSASGSTEQLEWYKTILPNHWQLQQKPLSNPSASEVTSSNTVLLSEDITNRFDIPIYTNTTYPFACDPPHARRTGRWDPTMCDAGLGGTTAASSELSPVEPGENATALYKRTFTIPVDWNKGGVESEGSPSPTSRVFLVFEGVDSCLSVWLNGHFVGYSQDSCLPAEFDVTDYINSPTNDDDDNGNNDNDGDEHSTANTICLQVSRWCDGSYLEDQDKWWLSGVYREVYLLRKPTVFIADYEVKTTIHNLANITTNHLHSNKEKEKEDLIAAAAADKMTAIVEVEVLLEGFQSIRECAGYTVKCEIWNSSDSSGSNANIEPLAIISCKGLKLTTSLSKRRLADNVIPNIGYADITPSTTSVARAVVSLSMTLTQPMLWTAEEPNLYTVVISLHHKEPNDNEIDSDTNDDSGGEVINSPEKVVEVVDVESTRIGIRTVQITGTHHQLCVNKMPLTIAGVNRHEFHPDSGRVTSETLMQWDAQLLKQFNFNAVRCSHYPPHPRWFEICDEVGIYVVDEANIETHGFQILGQAMNYLTDSPQWKESLLARVTRMVERDKNHACIIMWSLGNESGLGQAHIDMKKWLKLRDTSRFVQYESGGARSVVTDVICPMYLRPSWCEYQAQHDAKHRPVILCEYAHAMGNSGGSTEHYWRGFRDNINYPRLQGGFVWDMVDQGLSLSPVNAPYSHSHFSSATTMATQSTSSANAGTILSSSSSSSIALNKSQPMNNNINIKKKYVYGGDFGDTPNSQQFCINGLFGPDRVPHPSAWEIKHYQSPVYVEVQDLIHHSWNAAALMPRRVSLKQVMMLMKMMMEGGVVEEDDETQQQHQQPQIQGDKKRVPSSDFLDRTWVTVPVSSTSGSSGNISTDAAKLATIVSGDVTSVIKLEKESSPTSSPSSKVVGISNSNSNNNELLCVVIHNRFNHITFKKGLQLTVTLNWTYTNITTSAQQSPQLWSSHVESTAMKNHDNTSTTTLSSDCELSVTIDLNHLGEVLPQSSVAITMNEFLTHFQDKFTHAPQYSALFKKLKEIATTTDGESILEFWLHVAVTNGDNDDDNVSLSPLPAADSDTIQITLTPSTSTAIGTWQDSKTSVTTTALSTSPLQSPPTHHHHTIFETSLRHPTITASMIDYISSTTVADSTDFEKVNQISVTSISSNSAVPSSVCDKQLQLKERQFTVSYEEVDLTSTSPTSPTQLIGGKYIQVSWSTTDDNDDDNSISNDMSDTTVHSKADVSLTTGQLQQWSILNQGTNNNNKTHSQELLTQPLDLCTWRAPTDNDRGGGSLSHEAHWRVAGYHLLSLKHTTRCEVVSIRGGSSGDGSGTCNDSKDDAKTDISSHSTSSRPAVELKFRCSIAYQGQLILPYFATELICDVTYTFSSNGSITVEMHLNLPTYFPALPRYGLKFAVPMSSQASSLAPSSQVPVSSTLLPQCEWLGMGPYESYADRKGCVYFRHFQAMCIEELHVPYVYAQECASRVDPRWIRLATSNRSDNNNRSTSSGILIVPQRDDVKSKTTKGGEEDDNKISVGGDSEGCEWSWSASRISLERLEKCRHDYELSDNEEQQYRQSADTTQSNQSLESQLLQHQKKPSSSSVYVHVDRYMSGVGGYDSWTPNIDEQYMIYPHNDMKIKILLQPYEMTTV